MSKKTILGGLALALGLALVGCGSKGGAVASTKQLALVQGDPITMEEFYKYLELMPNVRVQVQNQSASLPVVDTLAFQALRDLIYQRIIAQMAKDEGVYPTAEEIQAEIKLRTDLNPDFLRSLNVRGMDLNTIRRSVAQDLAQERLITKGIVVTPEEVDQYIKDNPKQFVEPAQAEVTVIFLRDKNMQGEVDKALAGGQNFTDVAIRFSQVPNAAQNQGRFPLTVIDQFPTGPGTNVKALIEKTPELRDTDWVPFEGGVAKFFVNKKTAERPIALDDNRKAQVRRSIAFNRGQQATDLNARVAERMKEAQITVAYEALKEQWKIATEQMKKAEEAAALANSPTGGPAGATTPTPEPDEKKEDDK